jgi:hypothetical protein
MIETTETLVKTMESILEERTASQAKEKQAIEGLNAVLERMGYEIVPLHQGPRKRRVRGRAGDTAQPIGAADEVAVTGEKKRGRPPKPKGADTTPLAELSR